MMKRSDIGVAIYLKGSGDKKEAVLPLKKYDSEKAPHLLSVVAKEDGEYIVHFDNTDSPMMGAWKLCMVRWLTPFQEET